MKHLFLPSADNPILQWVAFVAFLLLLFICIGGFVVWLKVLRRRKPKRKKRHRNRNGANPTLAQSGGLPPKRDPNQPPPGP